MANNPTQLTILQDEIRRRYDTLSKRLKQVALKISFSQVPGPVDILI